MTATAASWAVENSYFDAWGRPRTVDAEAFSRITEALANHPATDRRSAARVVVLRSAGTHRIAAPPQSHAWQLSNHSGGVARGDVQNGGIALPPELPTGSYQLTFAPDRIPTLVVVTPAMAYQSEIFQRGKKIWLLAAQLYGVRSRRNWGHGDLTDLVCLLEVAAANGAAGIGLNPLHASFIDRSEQPSPYSPSSRLFLNPLYIDVDTVPEFPGLHACGLADDVARLRAAEFVNYAGVAEVKSKALRAAHMAFRQRATGSRRDAFEAFRRARGHELARFAAFETLRRRFCRVWWEWPAEWQRPSPDAVGALRRAAAEDMQYHEFVQWLADQQLAACRHRADELRLPIGLYLDVAVGVETGGADVWSNQDAFVRGLSIGAPPDPLNLAGQNWGLAPFHPGALIASDFSAFRQPIDAAMRYAGAIRLDHVLGLNRLFLIPDGMGADRGAYVRFPFEAMLAAVARDSTKRRCLVIGEDLGTIPDGLREALAAWGLWSYRVMMFERDDHSFRPPHCYPENALVTFSTHDLPTFEGWHGLHDLVTKRGLGLDPGESDHDRDIARRALGEALTQGGLAGADGVKFADVARFLARTPSRLLVVSLEDLLGVAEQVNIPGTVNEYPNWRRRMPVDVEDLADDDRLRALADVMATEGRRAD